MSDNVKIVLLDADVISHFIACGELLYLHKILEPYPLKILDNVYKEISRIHSRKSILDKVIHSANNISVIPFPIKNIDIKKEYARIKKENPLIGDGERACMAVARFNKNIIASSNFRDIAPYCTKFKIPYLGTLDILYIAWKKGVFSEKRCKKFILDAKNINNARFPNGIISISDYNPNDLTIFIP